MKNKIAIVTGGGSGIGRSTAIELAKQGVTVVIADRDEYGADKTCGSILQDGGEALIEVVDVTDRAAVQQLVKTTHDKFGTIDILINNAGIGGDLKFMDEYPDESFESVMDVNVRGVWYCMKAVLPYMKTQEHGGSIVNISSVAGLGAAPRMSAYAASKHAVIGLTKTAAHEYGKYNIRVNAVCPTVIDTPMGRSYMDQDDNIINIIKSTIPMKRFGEAFEVAKLISWLSSDENSFITGQAIAIDGGMKA